MAATKRKKRTTKKKPRAEVVPPNLAQCQAEKPNGHSFMTLGGKLGGRVRCEEEPSFVIVEKKAGNDGKRGCMSLCSECYEAFKRLNPRADVDVWEMHT